MMTVNRLTCLWPGLPQLWYPGGWAGLLAACAFAALVNGIVAATLLWPEIAPVSLRTGATAVAALWWLVAAGLSLRKLPQIAEATDDDRYKGLFVSAQTEYLRGNWIEAEADLRKLLRRSPRDVESLLLMATLQRRTRRFDESRQLLQQIARLEAAEKWDVELRAERELLRRQIERQRIGELTQRSDKQFANAAAQDEIQDDALDTLDSLADNDNNSSKPMAHATDAPQTTDRKAA